METLNNDTNTETINRDPRSIAMEIGAAALRPEEDKKSGEIVKPKKTVCMEVYPFSFENDTDDQEVFEKIEELLPFWKDLGINTIWLAPVYPSPRKDMGYDIADYEAIDERFGTLEDFDHLVAEAHNLGQKVIMDLVLNHTSTEHEWFQKALAGDPKYRSFYYFTDAPQEGWHNFFDDKSAWAPVPGQEGEYYLHSFHEKQADLRWFNENGELNYQLLEEFMKVINFWVKEHHVDGFRLDVPQAIDKDFSNSERNMQTLMSGDGEQSSLVVEKLFKNHPELITTIETFDPTDDNLIMSRYAGPGKSIQFAMNAFLAQQPESEMLELFSKGLRDTPYLMIAIQSHDTSRKDVTNEILRSLLRQDPQSICLFQGQEIKKEDPSQEEFSNEGFFESDAQADMQLKAAVEAKRLENGGSISQTEIDEIAASIRQGARANNRAPISHTDYIAELRKQSDDPGSIYNQLRRAIGSWVGQDEED